jgi:exosortase
MQTLRSRRTYTTIVLALGLVVLFAWAYAPTLRYLVGAWNDQPDYSHGFLVPFLSGFFLWKWRDSLPEASGGIAWAGLLVLVAVVGMRYGAARLHLTQVDAWTIPVWIFGVVWILAGRGIALWSLPALAFLYFMVPLPYRMEHWLSLPLQSIATQLSVWSLQCLGQPAIAEAHTIHLGAHKLEVEQACSGLRMLVGVLALAVGYVLMFPKSWWERAILLASVIPVALAANTARIVITGLLFQYVSSEAGQKFSHDFAGWMMILFAVALFGGVLWYLKRLFPEQQKMQLRDLIHAESTQKGSSPKLT